MKQLFSSLVLMLVAFAANAQITKTDGSAFVTSEGTPGGTTAPRWETSNNNWGYIKDGSILTYQVKCQSTGRYKVTIEDTKYASDGHATFAFQKDGSTIASTVVYSTGSNYNTDEAETSETLIAGDSYTLVVTFNGSGGSWIMNCRNFQFDVIVDTAPLYSFSAACSPANAGTVLPNTGMFLEGASIVVNVTEKPYFTFVKWEDESTNNPRTVVMHSEAKAITAYFEANPLTVPTTELNPFMIAWALCQGGNWNGSNLDSFGAGGTATYTVTNTKDCGYLLTFKAATNQDGAEINMQIKNGNDVVYEAIQGITKNGWTSYSDYQLTVPALTAGTYTFVVTFLRAAGGYTVNVKDIVFKEDKPIIAGQMLTLTVDGIALGEHLFNPLNEPAHATTIARSLTKLPSITATFEGVEGTVSMSTVAPTINGSTLVYAKTVSDTTYTITFNNYHPYTLVAADKTHAVGPSNGTGSGNNWTDGTITTTFNGDWGFKTNNGEKTISIPSNWKVKQLIFAGTGDNYTDGATLTTMTSEDATIYLPYNNVLKKGIDNEYVFTVENHVAGTPVKFTVENCGQLYIKTLKIVYEEVAVASAPAVVRSSVTNTAHRNHCVVTITYDHAVTAATATFGDKPARVRGLGTTTLKFSVWELDYDKTYSFTVAAGAEDAYGNKTTEAYTKQVTIGSKPDNTVTVFDYVVSNIQELKAALNAVNAVNTGNDAPRKSIFLKKGTYNANDLATDDSEAAVTACQLKANKNISLIGESRDEVIIIYTPKYEGMANRTMTLGYGCYAQDITFKTGVPVYYGRGVALFTEGEHVIINNCRAIGGQDTYLTGGSCYWKGGVIEGTTDFIFGGGEYLFDGTTISTIGGPITAGSHDAKTQWGYVFLGCTIKAGSAVAKDGVTINTPKDGGYDLGRPWQGEPRVAFINTTMEIIPSATGWGTMGKKNTHYFEYNSKKNGQPVDLSQRFCPDSENQTNNADYRLTAEQAAEYTMINLFGEVDGWYPAEEIPVVTKPGESTAVQSATRQKRQASNAYNLAGQKVSANYRGIVIRSGEKVFVK